MKQKHLYIYLVSVFLATNTLAQNYYPNLSIMPAAPKQGETVKFELDLTALAIKEAEDIDVLVLEYITGDPRMVDVSFERVGSKIIGSFPTNPKALAHSIGFQANGEIWENNNGNGFFVQMADPNAVILPESYAAVAILTRDFGQVMELNRSASSALSNIEKCISLNPDFKRKYRGKMASYTAAAFRGAEVKTMVEPLLLAIESDDEATEAESITALQLMEKLGYADRAKNLRGRIIKFYPTGTLVRQDRQKAINNEPKTGEKENLLKSYFQDFEIQSKEEKDQLATVRQNIVRAYGRENDFEKFREGLEGLPNSKKASVLNELAWNLAEKGENLDWALEFAAAAVETAKSIDDFPAYYSPRMNAQNQKYTVANNMDTYAYVLDKRGDTAEAARMEEEAVNAYDGKNDEMNELYVTYLSKIGSPKLLGAIEGFVKKGHASAKLKEQYVTEYVKVNKSSEKKAKEALLVLEKEAKAHLRKEVALKMLNYAAPNFSLKSLDNKIYGNENMIGKVFVFDFWATWCGPCKASFPGMQMAIEKYKSRSDVAFLFVDTWENADDKVKVVSDFITQKKYPFTVLMDTENSVVSAYGVSGIPTKFIVDKAGNVRFKAVGYAGSAESLVEELEIMIELATVAGQK